MPLGFKLEKEGRLLNQFIDFTEERGTSRITTDLSLRWAPLSPTHVSPPIGRTVSAWVRQFAKYQSGSDPRTEIPPLGLLPHHHQKKPPYVYTDAEIDDLIGAARQLRSPLGLRSATYATLFGLLAVTGMRLNEPLALDRTDVDLKEGILTIHGTKFGKSRLIPLHASTRDALAEYDSRRKRTLHNSNTPAFFVLEQDRRLSKSGVPLHVRETHPPDWAPYSNWLDGPPHPRSEAPICDSHVVPALPGWRGRGTSPACIIDLPRPMSMW